MKARFPRSFSLVASVLVVGLVVTGLVSTNGCGSGKKDKPNTKKTSGGDTTNAPPAKISVGTAPLGGAFYQVGAAISGALNQGKDAGGWTSSSPRGTDGTLENLRLLEDEEIDLGMANSTITYMAVRGEGGFKKKYRVKTIMTMFPLIAMFVTKEGTGVKTIADLKGKRVVVGPPGAGFEYFVGPILKAHGLSMDDIDKVNAGMQSSVGQLQDGSVSATFLGGGKKSPSISAAASNMSILLVPYDPKARDKLDADFPSFNKVTVAPNTYKGQTKAFDGLNVGAAHLIVRADADVDFVHKLTKVIYEARAMIAEKHPLGRAINAKNVVKNTGTEFHSGAVKYFKEAGIWPGSAKKGDAKKKDGGKKEAGEKDAKKKDGGKKDTGKKK